MIMKSRPMAVWTAVAALLGIPAASSAQQNLSVDDRVRLLKTLRDCWQTASATSASGSMGGTTSAQADGAFKKLLNVKASLDADAAFKARMRTEFAPLTSDAAAVAAIEACYRVASGGDSLSLASARRPPEPAAAKPTPPRKSLVPPPEWSCHPPAVFLAATCERGPLKGQGPEVLEEQGIVRGWQEEGVRHRTFCAHTVPSSGSITTQSTCQVKEGALRMRLEHVIEGKGGQSEPKGCAHDETCLTFLKFRIDGGGADVRIPPAAAGRYELQVDAIECFDGPELGGAGKVQLKAQFLGTPLPLTAGARFPLNSAGLVDVRFLGANTYELDYARGALTGITRCEVSLSLQPRP
jgi:hypothetical protein